MTGIKIGRGATNRITVSFPYNPDRIAKIKTMQGYRWHPEEKLWSLPSDSGNLDRLASLFEGERLDIDSSLQIIGEKGESVVPSDIKIKTTEIKNGSASQDSTKTSQLKFDKNFIKKLLDKLKVGNARSIHLNAIPGRSATRLDLSQLSSIYQDMPSNFIETILNNENFSFSISYDKVDLGELDEDEKKKLALISKRLNTLVIENTDNFLEFGLKNFGFGYPLLIKRDRNDPTKIIKAPLFIWHLDIERSYQNKNTWTIKKEEDSSIKPEFLPF